MTPTCVPRNQVVPVEVMQAAWRDLWDELLHPAPEDAPLVEEAQQDERGEGQPLHREVDRAA